MKPCLLALLAVALVLTTLPGLAQTSAMDPQSLIGEWQGKWTIQHPSRTTSGQYSLTIDKVEANTVRGKVYSTGRGGEFEGNVKGTLAGNRLTWSGSQFTTELTVDGNRMTGVRRGGPREMQISLTKK